MKTLDTQRNLESLQEDNTLREKLVQEVRFPLGLMANHPQKMVMQDNFDEPLDDLFDFNQDVKIINGKTK